MNFEQAKESVQKTLELENPNNSMDLLWNNMRLNALKSIESESDLASFELIKYSTMCCLFDEHIAISIMIRKLMKI